MAVDFYSVFAELQAMGIYEFILPFLLIFAIVFAILERLEIFGKGKKNINLMISIILGLFVIAQPEIVYLINSFLPKVSLFILVILMFLIIAGMFGASTTGWSGGAFAIALVVCVIAIIWALAGGTYLGLPYWLRPDPRDKAWIILIATIVIVVS
ncbi:MAG: hypothetical protein KKD48_03580, partial [Nanoarchaeota archaeon]|nr:hypothetical protein [Nanoarchaeota archaeon]